jgi:hypothetical protein
MKIIVATVIYHVTLDIRCIRFLNLGFRKKSERCTFLKYKTHLSFSEGKNMYLIFEYGIKLHNSFKTQILYKHTSVLQPSLHGPGEA